MYQHESLYGIISILLNGIKNETCLVLRFA